MPELTITVPKDLWLSSNQRRDRRADIPRVRDLRTLGFATARMHRLPRFEQVHVCAFIQYPTARQADPPNAWPTLKAILDGMTDAGVWDDDSSEHVVATEFRREVGKSDKGTYRVRLVLTGQDTPF